MNIKISIIVFILLSVFHSGCDPCSGTGPSEPTDENYIYFSSLPLNSSKPSIYRIKTDGIKIEKILDNGIIFSPPSKNGKLCYLVENSLGKKAIFTCNTDGSNQKQITVDNFWLNLDNPVISSDGNFIAAYTGRNDLYLATSNGSFWRQLSNNYFRNSIPSFSPDGKLIAFYESKSLAEPWKIKIVKTSNINEIVYERSFNYGINTWYGDLTISWSKDASRVYYTAVNSELNDLIVEANLSQKKDFDYEIKFVGALMPDFNDNNEILAFAGRDGNIWTRDFNQTNVNYEKLTTLDDTEYYLYPQFSNKGEKIIFIRYFYEDDGLFNGSLILFDLKSKKLNYLCDNIFKAFWGN